MPTLALNAEQQADARGRAVDAAKLCYDHEPDVHYTQGSSRWQGISEQRDASHGDYPNYCDCSSFATWCLWNALYLPYGMEDVVNASGWQAGYTGTMLNNGQQISPGSMIAGDCIIYGTPGSTGAHTAICVGVSGGTPMVVSHGSETGPHYLAFNYRTDVMSAHRYIDGNPHQASGGSSPAPLPEPPEDTVSLFAVLKQDGRIEVFVQKESGQVLHTWQTAKDGGWAGAEQGKNAKWYDLGNPGK